MKRIHTKPLWLGLAVALSPVVHANEKTEKAEKAAADTRETKSEQSSEAEDPLADLQQYFRKMNHEIREARSQAADAAAQRDAARKEALAVREAKQQLEGQLGALRKQLQSTDREVAQWREKATVLERKLGAGEEAYEKLGTFRDEMKAALDEFAVLKKDLANVRGELQAPAERVALKKELAEAKAAHEAVAGKLKGEQQAHSETKGFLAARDKVAKELRQALHDLKESAHAQLQELAKAKQERDALAKNLENTGRQLADARREADGAKQAKVAVEQQLDATRKELGATQETLAVLKREASELRTSLKPLAAEIQLAQAQSAKATAALKEANTARQNAEQDRQRLADELKDANDRLAAALQTQNGLKQQVATKSSEIEGLRKKVEQMEAAQTAQASGDPQESAGL